MGQALVSQLAFKQNITGTNPESLAAGTNDSLTVPNFSPGSRAWMLEAWAGVSAHAADFQIRSPSFHDNIRGIRLAYDFNPTLSGADGDPQFLLPYYVRQPLYASDVLTIEVIGTATDNVDLAWLAYYEDLPGADQRLISWAELESRLVDYVGIKVAVTAGATGDYGTGRALNADDDRLIANTDYAVIGITSQLPATVVTFIAPETSGRRIGLPLHWDEQKSGGFFPDLSMKYSLPLIPVLNSNNKGNVIFNAASSGGAIATAATVLLAELR
jgi:hypothetical protein